MLPLIENLFSSKILIGIFDKILDFDIFDYRQRGGEFTFFSPTGIIVLFAVIALTGNLTGLNPGSECRIQDVFEPNAGCTFTWLSVGRLVLVLFPAYLLASLMGQLMPQLAPSFVTLEHLASLFVFGCLVMVAFHAPVFDSKSLFTLSSDLAQDLFNSGGTTNNAIVSFLVALITILVAIGITLLKRVTRDNKLGWSFAASLVVVYQLVFLSTAIAVTFFRFS